MKGVESQLEFQQSAVRSKCEYTCAVSNCCVSPQHICLPVVLAEGAAAGGATAGPPPSQCSMVMYSHWSALSRFTCQDPFGWADTNLLWKDLRVILPSFTFPTVKCSQPRALSRFHSSVPFFWAKNVFPVTFYHRPFSVVFSPERYFPLALKATTPALIGSI